LAGITTANAQERPTTQEYKLKAAFVYNFVRFIDWPNAPASMSSRSITICVVGENPFGNSLDEIIVSGDQKGIHTKYLQGGAIDSSCNVAAIFGSNKNSIGTIIESFHNLPTLTISDSPGFLSSGGEIELIVQEGKVRFYINETSGKAKGLVISSKLSALALRPN